MFGVLEIVMRSGLNENLMHTTAILIYTVDSWSCKLVAILPEPFGPAQCLIAFFVVLQMKLILTSTKAALLDLKTQYHRLQPLLDAATTTQAAAHLRQPRHV